MSGKGIIVYPDHKIKIGYLENNKLVGDITEITYNKKLDKVFKTTGYYYKGNK
mgnify:CR=1 FL=1